MGGDGDTGEEEGSVKGRGEEQGHGDVLTKRESTAILLSHVCRCCTTFIPMHI